MLSKCMQKCTDSLAAIASAVSSAHAGTASQLPPCHPATPRNSIRIGSLNIRGKLGGNMQAVSSLLDDVNLDIIGIQETLHATVDVPGFFWLSPSPPKNLAATSRSPLRGIGFYVRTELRSAVSICKQNRPASSSAEILWLKVCGRGEELDSYVCTAYAPGPQHGADTCQHFFELLTEQCVHFAALGEVLLLGDFNARIGVLSGDTAENGNCKRFLEFLRVAFSDGVDGVYRSLLSTQGPNLGKPTRLENDHASVIDYIIGQPSSSRVRHVHVGMCQTRTWCTRL